MKRLPITAEILEQADSTFAQNANIRYNCYMDAFLLLARTRWQPRRAVRRLNLFFHAFGFQQHPDKTFIGKTEKGFDWMRYFFTAQGTVSISLRAWTKHLITLCQHYEQTRRMPWYKRWRRVAEYRLRWVSRWAGP